MKIEKLNENQIRCTLTSADLADRQLKLSELAYGSDKAKSLFRDMMEQAFTQFGFEADDIPLMIEAIPSSTDSIVLIVTKVEDPEELDTRFSRFSNVGSRLSDSKKQEVLEKLEGAEDFQDLLGKVKKAISSISDKDEKSDKPEAEVKPIGVRLFSFGTLDDVISTAKLIRQTYHGANTLYKDESNDIFILAMAQDEYTTESFNRICNMLSEYATPEKVNGAILAFLEEHCETIVDSDAIEKLAQL